MAPKTPPVNYLLSWSVRVRTFAELLVEYTRRTGISDSELARALGVRRQTIFRWKEGLVDRPRNRQDVLACAVKLRLTPEECDELLLAAGFPPESGLSLPTDSPVPGAAEPRATDPFTAQPGPAQPGTVLDRPLESPTPAPVDAASAEIAIQPARRPRARLVAIAGALVVLLSVAIAVALAARGDSRVYPVAKPGETLVIVGAFPDVVTAPSPGSRPHPGFQERLVAAIGREVQAGRVERFQVAGWPDPLSSAEAAEAARRRSGGAIAVGGTVADGQATVIVATTPVERADDVSLEALAALTSDLSLTIATGSTEETQALALLAMSRTYLSQGDRDRARAALTQALSRPPSSPGAVATLYLNLGYALLSSRPPDLLAAAEALDRAIELEDTPAARLDRGLAYVRLGDSSRALADLEKAASLAPTDPTVNLALCWAHALDRRPELARPYCEVATRQAAGRTQEALAVVDAEQGRTSDAADELRGFLKWLGTQPAELMLRYGSSRSEWLQSLEAGRDPFDDVTLDRLRRE